MHQLLSALVSILLSFCHQSATSHPLEAANTFDSARHSAIFNFPSRHGLPHTTTEASYAGTACLSCGTTSVSFTVR